MKDLMGLIYTGENDQFLRELTLTRAVAALPVVGRYRVIDFQMSSLVNSGARVCGTVVNSVIFRGVTVEKGAVVRNSIVMQDANVGEKAEMDHCIIDKNAAIRAGGRLIGPETYPIVISKNVTI